MTTYKKYSIKNRKTRKIKLFKGGAPPEDNIIQVAIDKVKESVSNGKKEGIDDLIKKAAIDKVNTVTGTAPVPGTGTGNAAPVPGTGNAAPVPGTGTAAPVKSGKKVSILIDFYNKLLKSEDYGKKIDNFNKFYEIININKNGMNMTESITGVEELFKIFKNEVEYIKATDAEKDAKKKALSSNREKTKEINIEYKNGDYTITGEPVAPSTSVSSVLSSLLAPSASSSPPSPTSASTIEEKMQEIAKNTVIKETALNLDDSTLVKLYNEIKTNTKTFNKNNSTIASNKNEIEKLQNKIEKLNTENEKNREQLKVITGNIQKKNIAIKIGKNNKQIDKFKIDLDTKTKIDKNANNELPKLNTQKDNYLKLLNRAYDILTQELSNMKLNPGNFGGVKSTKEYHDIKSKMQTIRNKIYNLNYGTKFSDTLKQTVSSSFSSSSSSSSGPVITALMTPETDITKAAIKAVNDAVNAANP